MANRFNTRYGRTFVVPRGGEPAGRRAGDGPGRSDRQDGQVAASDAGLIYLLDKPDVVRRKVGRAVTDAGGEVAYDPYRKPGVSNLLEILAACERDQPDVAALRFRNYGELKEALTQTIVDTLRADPAALRRADGRPRPTWTRSAGTGPSGPATARPRPYGGPSTRSDWRPDDYGETAWARSRSITGALGQAVTR